MARAGDSGRADGSARAGDVTRVLIRRALPADAPACARFHVACWQEAYAGMLADAVLAGLTAGIEGRIAAWRAMIAAGHPRWVALAPEGTLAGFVGYGAGRDTDIELRQEVHAFYVGKSWWGSGLADRLMTDVVGASDAYLWVLRDNRRAQAFYGRHGFRLDGAEKFLARLDAYEVRMVRRRGGNLAV